MRWIGFAAGGVLVGWTVWAAVAAGFGLRRPWLLRGVVRGIGAGFGALGRRLRRDGLAGPWLAARGPVAALAVVLVLWGGLVTSVGLILLPWQDPTPATALRWAAASVLGLGLVPAAAIPSAIAVLGALGGLVVLVMTVVFLLRLVAVVGRGNSVVAAVEARAGVPPWGPALGASYSEAGAADRLPDLYRRAERWAAELVPHGDPLPLWFRSAGTRVDPVTALVAVMDCAALDAVTRPGRDHSEARLLIRTGTDALVRTRETLRIGAAPVRTAMVTEEGFAGGMSLLRESGFAPDQCPSGAWDRFVRIRRGYAPAAVAVARRLLSPPAPWMGEWPGPPAPDAAGTGP